MGEPGAPNVDVLKAALRADLRRRRRALAAALPDAGEWLADSLRASPLAPPRTAALYIRQGSEIDPAPLAHWLAGQGVEIAMPVVVEQGQPLAFRRLGDILALDGHGLPCPMPHEPLMEQPEIVFTPLLGFDRRGGRIGQGGGFYDRTLQALRAGSTPPRVIGLAYAEQEVAHIPQEPCDQRLDGVLTEKAYLSTS